jgi:hypothetical protein
MRCEFDGFKLPYTASCGPLLGLLIQRFIWHRSIIKSFYNPLIFLQYMFILLLVALLLNFSIKLDHYYDFDIIALLWPCYGYIAISFIFLIGSILLFIGAACNSLTNPDNEYENEEIDPW